MSHASRRAFLRAASLAVLAWPGLPGAGRAQGLRGCCIVEDNAASALRELWNDKPNSGGEPEIARLMSLESGVSPGFERLLGRVLADMAGVFDLSPGFGFYDDTASPNAVAIDRAVVRNTNGSVAFGRALLQRQLAIDPDAISVAAICAHEFAHIYQYRTGFYDDIERRYPRHITELHADFLAGAYLHHFEEMRPHISLQGVGRSWEEMGDTEFTEASTHGTSEMRLDAIQSGYALVRRHPDWSLRGIASDGLDFVAQYASG